MILSILQTPNYPATVAGEKEDILALAHVLEKAGVDFEVYEHPGKPPVSAQSVGWIFKHWKDSNK